MTRKLALIFLATILAGQVAAEALVASHTIRSRSVISAADVQLVSEDHLGALTSPMEAIGMEARVVLYAGRPIRIEDLTRPAMIERNQIVSLIYHNSGLAISTEGRSLARAALGERVRVMNLQSRSTVTGTVDASGNVIVGSNEMNFTSMETQR